MIFSIKSKKNSRGFSLIELLVVVSIFLIVTTITLFKQSKFSSDILITNTAYEVALSIREAQVLGVGSRQQSFVNRKQAYGVYIPSSSIGVENGEYLQYSESPVNDVYYFFYDPNDTSNFSILSSINLTRSQRFKKFCVVVDSNTKKCSDELQALNIAFVKPNLDAKIFAKDLNQNIDEYRSAEIVVESSLGDKCRIIDINSVGQIAVRPVTAGTNGCNN